MSKITNHSNEDKISANALPENHDVNIMTTEDTFKAEIAGNSEITLVSAEDAPELDEPDVEMAAGNVKLKTAVTETVFIPDGQYKGVVSDAFCYNYAEEKVMLKIELTDGTVFVNPVTLDQLARYPYSQFVSQLGAEEVNDLIGASVVLDVKSKSDSEFSYVKKITLDA